MKLTKMKRILLYTISCLLVLTSHAKDDGDAFQEEKNIRKSFLIAPDGELEVINKYGNIVVETYEGDSVKFDISIKVSSDKLSKINELIENIDVRFSNGSDYVAAETNWGGTAASGLRVDLLNAFTGNRKVEVNYHITIPESIEIDLENKFGDITLPSLEEQVKINLAHGNLRARALKEVKQLKLEYGKAKIKEVEEGDFIVRSADVTLDEAENIRIESISSEWDIEEVEKVTINSKHDKISIEEVKTLKIIGLFTDFKIEELKKEVTGTVNYGEISVDEVATSFIGIDLEGSSTEIDLEFSPEIAYRYEVELEKGKRFSIPSQGNTTDLVDDSGDVHHYEGVFATMPIGGKPANVKVTVKSSYVNFGLAD